MDKERAIFHELLTDFSFTVFSLEIGEQVRESLEEQQYCEAQRALEKGSPFNGRHQDEAALRPVLVFTGRRSGQQPKGKASPSWHPVFLGRDISEKRAIRPRFRKGSTGSAAGQTAP